ncbi:four-carbon acid sugar kinase family protein [uncultured Cohaesibacter sp.]|uniref:four-carbon acid sugar kinase family protein n=1 Tax=uncultured Cohaesibacter sp. TaxID=1002546 RepID=UPI003748E239
MTPPPKGNIGPVAEALANALDVNGVVAGPAFSTLGRTVHQGHLFVKDRLVSEAFLEKALVALSGSGSAAL